MPAAAKHEQLHPRIKSHTSSGRRSSTGGKDTAHSVCLSGPQQIILRKPSNSLPRLRSSFLTSKAARSQKKRSSTPLAGAKVLPRLPLRSDKFAKRPDSRSGPCCSQVRQERRELPNFASSSAIPDVPPAGEQSPEAEVGCKAPVNYFSF